MPTIAEVRRQYPQYKDLSDQELGDALHAKFYPDMPRDQFNAKVGLAPPSPEAQRAAADAAKRVASTPGIVRSVNNGFLFNLMPTIDAAGAAAETGIHNAFAHATGQPDSGYGMGDAFNAVRAAETGSSRKFAQDHPVQNIAGTVVGAIANPVAKAGGQYVGQAANLGQATLRSGMVGAGLGAAYGAGGADPGVVNRLKGAAAGGATGAAIGAVTPAALSAVSAGVKGTKGLFGGAMQGARAMVAPVDPLTDPSAGDSQQALKLVAAQLQAAGRSPADLAGATEGAFGRPITTAEAMGRPGVQTLAALARRSGSTPDAVEAALRDRASMAPTRILDDVQQLTGIKPEAVQGDLEGLVGRLQAEAKPLYDAALSHPGPVWNSDLAALAQRPVIKKAIGTVANDMLNAGQDPTVAGLKLDPDTGWTLAGGRINSATGGVEHGGELAATMEPQPTASTWDMVKKAIGRQIERHAITGRALPDSQSQGNYGVRVAAQDLTKALAGDPAHGVQGAIPGYRAALDKAGDYLSIQDAFDRGQKLILDPKVNEATFGKVLDSLDEPSQEAFKGGFANKLFDLAQNGRLTPRTLQAPRVQAKLQAVYGDDVAQQLMARIQTEAKLAATGGRMMPGTGSATAELLNAGAEQDGGINAIASLAKKAKSPVSALLQLNAMSKTASTSPPVRNAMGQILLQPPELTAAQLADVFRKLPPRYSGAPPVAGLLGGYAAEQQRH